MKYVLAFLIAVPLFSFDYDIAAKLDAEKKLLKCSETIIWENKTDVETNIIPFHLYMNAFSNSETVFMMESGGKHRRNKSDKKKEDSYGYCKVSKVTVTNEDITGTFQYLSDIDNPEQFNLYHESEVSEFVKPDNSIGVLILSRPVLPGESVTITLDFETKFPKVLARTGYVKNYFFGGQWFPKVAFFEGEKGWNVHLFHLNSEFYAEFCDYRVILDVPEHFVTGATGILKSEKIENSRRILEFSAENVIDFAFTTWDLFKVAKDKWKNVDLTLLYQPGNEGLIERQFKALKAGMESYSYLCGFDYPYPAFTLVDVPLKAQGSGGMEYPMLVTNAVGTPLLPEEVRALEGVIIHEFGHNYFYGILATNEFEHAWMDEGMNSFADSFAIERHYGNIIDLPFVGMSKLEASSIGYGRYKGPDYPGKYSWDFASNGGYGTLSYSKMTVAFKTLENIVGHDTFLEIFRTYGNTYKFKHPTPDNFFDIVKEIGGEEAYEFIKRTVYTSDKIDFAVSYAKSKKKRDFVGYRDFVLVQKKDNETSKTKKKDKTDKKITYVNHIRVENRGDFVLPVDIKVVFGSGDEQMFSWDGSGGFKKLEFESKSEISYVTVDPERVYIMDVDMTNNSKVCKGSKKTISMMALTAAAVVEALFCRFAFLI